MDKDTLLDRMGDKLMEDLEPKEKVNEEVINEGPPRIPEDPGMIRNMASKIDGVLDHVEEAISRLQSSGDNLRELNEEDVISTKLFKKLSTLKESLNNRLLASIDELTEMYERLDLEADQVDLER